jgi:hypothetical protein
MKVSHPNHSGRLMASFVLILVLLAAALPSAAGPCEKALGRCLVDAGLSSLLGMVASGGITSVVAGTFCGMGYAFCLVYVI